MIFNTGYFDKGILVMNRSQIAWNYVSNLLWFDLVTGIPIYSYISVVLKQDLIYLLPSQLIVDALSCLKMIKFFKLHLFEKKVCLVIALTTIVFFSFLP